MARTSSTYRRLAPVVAAVLVGTVLAVTGTSTAWAAGVRSVADLRDAPVPAVCQHPATQLSGYKRDYGMYGGSTQLLKHKAVFGRLGRHRGSVGIAPLVCSAGGVTWPEVIAVYGPGPRLLGSVDLRRVRPHREHEDVRSMRFSHHELIVDFLGYDGAGFDYIHHRGTLSWRHGRVSWHLAY